MIIATYIKAVQEMITQSNINVLETLRKFKAVGIPVSFLVPTVTAMEKSIMDATEGTRQLLEKNGLHSYALQPQGPEYKAFVETAVFSEGKIEYTKTSLYRPLTKDGDPRIWVYGLNRLAEATDLLAVVVAKEKLVIINCSKSDLNSILTTNSILFSEFLSSSVVAMSAVAAELMDKLRVIYDKGFVDTMRAGDTGVGYTLETLLGIQANSSQAPDYKGIELKAGRTRSHHSGRITIFSQVPNWCISRLKGSRELLIERGRFNETKQRRQLFHQMSVVQTNSYGPQLEFESLQAFHA